MEAFHIKQKTLFALNLFIFSRRFLHRQLDHPSKIYNFYKFIIYKFITFICLKFIYFIVTNFCYWLNHIAIRCSLK